MSTLPSKLWNGFLDQIVCFEGSTRGVALLRIAFVFVIWSRFAATLRPENNLSPDRLLISVVFWFATPMMLVGFKTRLATLATALTLLASFVYFGQILGQEPLTHRHVYAQVVLTCFLAMTPCGQSYSVDRWLAVRRARQQGAPLPLEYGPLWGVRLLAIQVAIIYLFSTWEKTYPGFLLGDRLEGLLLFVHFGSDYPNIPGFHLLALVGSLFTWTAELVLSFGLFVRSWQKVLIPLGVFLHMGIYIGVPVLTFTATTLAAYLAFIHPDDVHRITDRLMGTRP